MFSYLTFPGPHNGGSLVHWAPFSMLMERNYGRPHFFPFINISYSFGWLSKHWCNKIWASLNNCCTICRAMTRAEKRQLGKQIQKLPEKAFDRVVEIVQQRNLSARHLSDDIFINLEEQVKFRTLPKPRMAGVSCTGRPFLTCIDWLGITVIYLMVYHCRTM